MFPMITRTPAGPRDLCPGSRDNEELPEVEVQSDSGGGAVSSLRDEGGTCEWSSITSTGSESDPAVHNITSPHGPRCVFLENFGEYNEDIRYISD